MKRFQTSKYRNAAPKIPKKEVNVKDFMIFPFKTTIFRCTSAGRSFLSQLIICCQVSLFRLAL